MRTVLIFLFAAIMGIHVSAQSASDGLVFVKGGAFTNTKSTNYYGRNLFVSSFYIGKYEVTQKEWKEVMATNPAQFKADDSPVEMVTWYECIEYCNHRSARAGFKPYYNIDKTRKDPNNTNDADALKWTITLNTTANGYRLPTEAEWEYAAGGGQLSKGYAYCGGNDLDKLGWYWRNSGDKYQDGFWTWPTVKGNNDRTHRVGSKEPNELGLYDMSGNAREFCWDWYGDELDDQTWKVVESNPTGNRSGCLRLWKGGGWMGGEFCCEVTFRAGYEPYYRGNDQGLRVCRGP